MRIAPEGWVVIVPFVLVCLGVPAALVWVMPVIGGPLFLPGLVLSFWAFWFFRDPPRVPPQGDDLVISPADGVVLKVDSVPLPRELRTAGSAEQPERCQRVSIFLSLLNVHVNRVPMAGRIERIVYTPGKFFNASLDKASEFNERSAVLMRDKLGRPLAFVQIAGLVARRIVSHLREGQQVGAGERFGLIRFGSRAEIYLPIESEVIVQPGDKTIAGESVLARMPAMAGMNAGERRPSGGLSAETRRPEET